MGLNPKNYINHKHPIHKYVNNYIQKQANETIKCFSKILTPFIYEPKQLVIPIE